MKKYGIWGMRGSCSVLWLLVVLILIVLITTDKPLDESTYLLVLALFGWQIGSFLYKEIKQAKANK